MRDLLIGKIAPALAAAVGISLAWAVLYSQAGYALELRLPGRDRLPTGSSGQAFNPQAYQPTWFGAGPHPSPAGSAPAAIVQSGLPIAQASAWPNFRGRQFSGVSDDPTPLVRSWGASGPKALWSIPLGEGYAGPAILNDKVYLLDYDPPDNWLVRPGDLGDVKTLAAALVGQKNSTTPSPQSRIWKCLSPAMQATLADIAAAKREPDPAARAEVAAGLNELLGRRDLYRHEDFANSAKRLPSETKRLLDQAPPPAPPGELAPRETLSQADVLRLNRILLEAAAADLPSSQHADVLRCISLADGRDLWRFSYGVKTKRNHGMSRTVPAVTDKYVLTLGPRCHVVCLDAQTGRCLWGIDLQEQYGTAEPPWYAGQCPLIDGDKAILAPGGTSLMIAVDLASGKVLWQSPNPHRWQMTHSSIVPMELAGRRMYVYCGSGGVAGIDAADGRILWETTQWKIAIATVPTPVVVGDGRVFLSGGYEAGCMMLQVAEADGQFSARPLWRLPATAFGSTQQTPLLHQGLLYGTRPDGQLVCLDLEGVIRWTSGPANRFGQGLGPYLIADGLLLVMNDTGTLSMVAADPQGFAPLGQAKVLSGHDSWGPMAIAGGKLLARDLTSMVCLDLRASQDSPPSNELSPAPAADQAANDKEQDN